MSKSILLALATALVLTSPVSAAPSHEELYATVKSLQAEVQSLRQELREVRRDRRSQAPTRSHATWTAAPAAPASTAPIPVAAPLAPTWTGLYAGVAFGVGTSHAHGRRTSNFTSFSLSAQPPFSASSFASVNATGEGLQETAAPIAGSVSGSVGYDYDMGNNAVIGVQGDASLWQRATYSKNYTTMFSANAQENQFRGQDFLFINAFGSPITGSFVQDTVAATPLWTASLLGKVGYRITPTSMVYVLGGGTYGAFAVESASNGLFGVTGGVGGEMMISGNWSAIADYRFTHFFAGSSSIPSASFSPTTPFGSPGTISVSTTANAFRTTVAADLHQFRFGFLRRFE